MRIQFERTAEVLARRAIKKSKFHKEITEGLWTPPVYDGRAALHIQNETDRQLAARAASASKSELKELVQRLLAERKALLIDIGRAA